MSRSGFVLGPLAVGLMNLPADAVGLAVPVRTIAGGLLHSGYALNLAPWRRPSPFRYSAPRPGLVLAWRL